MSDRKGKPANVRVFGWAEVIFDALYLLVALAIGVWLLLRASGEAGRLAGVSALVLGGGDAFHLVPRIAAVLTNGEQRLRKALGAGKFVTSITMTVFYLLLWHTGITLYAPQGLPGWTILLYVLAAIRIGLCFFPQNRWLAEKPPVDWAIYRNIPFLLLGAGVAVLFGLYGQGALQFMWFAIALSFGFYLPVVIWSNERRALGMLMLPKTCAYVWILGMLAAALI